MSTLEEPHLAGRPSRGVWEVERGSDVPISTQLFWQIAYQIDSGRLLPGSRLPTVRELGAALRVNPNTIRAVYKRLADAGYVSSRQGAGTHVADVPPQRRGSEDLAGIVAVRLRRAAQAGFTADEVASATFAAASERTRPGPRVRVMFAECTPADAAYGADRIAEAFPEATDAEGTLLEQVDERIARFHYDIVATTAFHADETRGLVGGRAPVVAMMVGPAFLELMQEVAGLPEGAKVGLVCASPRGAANMNEMLSLSGSHGVELIDAIEATGEDLSRVDAQADLILLSRQALALGLDGRFSRPERLRAWTYDFDPAGLELLRRTIERAQATRSPLRATAGA
ncbi:MAG: GntR family transcriptional regulator [Candidatus Limnocylindrales bacterium]